MEKTCDCDCHKLHPIPCMFCAGRHGDAPEPGPVEPFNEVHDEQTEPGAHLTEFPF